MDFRRTDFRRALNRNRSLLRRPYCCRSYCDSNVRPPTFDKSFDRVGNMNELKNTTSQTSIDSNREDSRAGDNRRTALAKLGLYAAYDGGKGAGGLGQNDRLYPVHRIIRFRSGAGYY